jgi:hypothetical protein
MTRLPTLLLLPLLTGSVLAGDIKMSAELRRLDANASADVIVQFKNPPGERQHNRFTTSTEESFDDLWISSRVGITRYPQARSRR